MLTTARGNIETSHLNDHTDGKPINDLLQWRVFEGRGSLLEKCAE